MMSKDNTNRSKLYPMLKETGDSARDIRKYTITLQQFLDILMNEKNISKKRLALDSNLSEKMVQRIRNEADYEPSLQSIIAICHGLEASIPESYLLVDLAGHRIRPYVYEEAVYLRVLLEGRGLHIEEINDCLRSLNCRPLGTI